MNNLSLPFQKITLEELANHIDDNGQMNSVLNICGFLLCQHGWAKVMMGDTVYTIQKGDMYIYAPGTFINIIEWSNDLQGLAFKSTFDYILPFLDRASNQKTILNIRNQPCIALTPQQQSNVEEMAEFIDRKMHYFETLDNKDAVRQFMLRELECLGEAFISELLLYYICSESPKPETTSHKEKIIQSFLILLFQHYKKQRDVTFYAEQLFLTPRYFSTLIKQETGKTALNWISEMVISHACQLLAYSDTSIKEIAQELNFPTQSFFGKYFKQYMQLSPLQYRQQQQAKR